MTAFAGAGCVGAMPANDESALADMAAVALLMRRMTDDQRRTLVTMATAMLQPPQKDGGLEADVVTAINAVRPQAAGQDEIIITYPVRLAGVLIEEPDARVTVAYDRASDSLVAERAVVVGYDGEGELGGGDFTAAASMALATPRAADILAACRVDAGVQTGPDRGGASC